MRRPLYVSMALAIVILCQWLVPQAVLAEGEADPLWNQPSFDKKLTSIGQRILAANGINERIAFTYNREHVRNAYATRTGRNSGGNEVVVYQDILSLVDSDDEVAAILSHEVAHITLRHQQRAILPRVGVRLLYGTAMVAAAMANPYAAGAAAPGLARLARGAGVAPVSRGYEKEADLAGLDYLVKAGYNPLAMETMMNKILSDASLMTRFFADHPMGTGRLQYIHTAIVNRFPQFLSEETRNNPVPGSPYQMQSPTIPNRTVYATPPATANPAPANNPVSPTSATTGTPATAALMLATTAPNPNSGAVPNSRPANAQPLTQTSVPQPVPTAEKTAVASSEKTATFPASPTKINYQTPVKAPTQGKLPKTTGQHHIPTSPTVANTGTKPVAQVTTTTPATNPATATQQSPSMSVAQTLLELPPTSLRLVKLVSQRGYMTHRDLTIEFEALDEDTLTAILLDLQNNRKLLNIQGAEASATYTLTPRAARVLHPQ